jgi:hypothetical protein
MEEAMREGYYIVGKQKEMENSKGRDIQAHTSRREKYKNLEKNCVDSFS